jgi:hypothetical protein
LEDVTDHAASFTGKHTSRQIVEWDRSFQRAIIMIACFELMVHRGYKKDQGGDSAITKRADDAEAWLAKVASGEVEPFVNDGADYDEDGPRGGSSANADDWTRYGTGCGNPCGWCC